MTDKKMQEMAERLNQLDDELHAAERAGNVSAQIAALRERARCWREWAEHLAKAGRDNHAAVLSAMRDEITAGQLEAGAR